MCVCGFRAHPPTRRGGEHWSYHGSGRFGDTMPWRTRVARGARDWDASAIPPGEVLDKHNGFYCVAVCFSAVVVIFFVTLRWGDCWSEQVGGCSGSDLDGFWYISRS